MSSVMLRGASQIARQEECEAIMGALLSGQSVGKRFVADVGNVHHHAETIHFADDILAEIGEAVVSRLCRWRNPPTRRCRCA